MLFVQWLLDLKELEKLIPKLLVLTITFSEDLAHTFLPGWATDLLCGVVISRSILLVFYSDI